MIDNITYEALMELIDQVEMATTKQPCTCFTQTAWLYELKHHPERFRWSDKRELLWLGNKVVVIGDDRRFWYMVDKIIPKENNQ